MTGIGYGFPLVRTLSLIILTYQPTGSQADLPDTIEKIKPSIVAIGTYKKTQSPPFIFRGTGFVVLDGNHAATNAHVLPETAVPDAPELAILSRSSHGENSIRRARILNVDRDHDLAIIGFDGPQIPPLKIGESSNVREGQEVAFTGFPIGGILGFSPVTHRGIVSAITPIAIPGGNVNQLNEKLIKQLKRGTFDVFQLDGTAYPGNSGSPVFDPANGEVLGIINMVFIKGSKEAALSLPSGISYAIPSRHLAKLCQSKPSDVRSKTLPLGSIEH